MAAQLGYAGTGYGQGALQQRQVNRDEQFRQAGQALQGRQVDIQQQGQELAGKQFEDTKTRADREFARREVDRYDNLLNDPKWLESASPATIEKVRSGRNKVLSRYPEFDYAGEARQVQTAPNPTPNTAPAAAAAPEQTAPVRPELFGLGQQQAQALPYDQNFGAGAIDPGPSQFDPMGIPGNPDRPIPNAGVGVTGSQNPPQAGSFPPNILPPGAPVTPPSEAGGPTPQPGAGGAVGGSQAPQQLDPKSEWQRIASDPNESVANRRMALDKISQIEAQGLQNRATETDIGYKQALTKQVGSTTALDNAYKAEQIAMLRYERLEKIPEELRIALIKAKKGQQLSPENLIAIENLKLETLKLSKQIGDSEWQQAQSLEELVQRERLQANQLGAASQGRFETAALGAIAKEYSVKNPVTGAVGLKPGGLEAILRKSRELIGQGQTPQVSDANPGHDPGLWAAVTTPGFNAAAALSSVSGDPVRTAQLKKAISDAAGIGGAIAKAGGQPRASSGAAPRPAAANNKVAISNIVGDSSLTNSEKIEQLEAKNLPVPASLRARTGGVPVKYKPQKPGPNWKPVDVGAIDARKAEARRIAQRGSKRK